jgi:hypothetical protein
VTGALDAALGYAARGWPVLPVKPGGKEPLTPHGVKDATTSRAVIRRWWSRWPDANVGIATGEPGPDVLDVDVREGGSGFGALNRLKQAGLITGERRIVRTPSGGLHLYFTGTAQSCGSLPARHLDFKAAGGYVLAPPSAVRGQPYELVRDRPGGGPLDWAACKRLLDPPRPSGREHPLPTGTRLDWLTGWVSRQPHGNRNQGLHWAARRAVEAGLDPWPLVDAAVQAGHDEGRARRTVASAIRAAAR